MFNLFGKKKESPKAPPAEDQSAPYRAFAAGFLPEELDILAVTGPSGFGPIRPAEGGLTEAGILLTAWLEDGSPDLHREPALLVALADQNLLAVLRQRLPINFILKFKARRSPDSKRLLLTNLPAPGFDPDLKAILDEQKKPITFETEDLGAFTFSRTMNWFQNDVDWLEQTVQLAFDPDDGRAGCLLTARALLADPAGWDGKARALAAQELLAQANAAGQEEEGKPLTPEQFQEWISLETILVFADGRFELWFNDGGLFLGSPIHVSGSLTDGLTGAQVEG